jgi:nitrite reductase/ring-hydroxylating ferredoxin subunit
MLYLSSEHRQKLKEKDLTDKHSGKRTVSAGKKISRKQFFQRIGFIALIPLAGAWLSTTEQAQLSDKRFKTIKIPGDLAEGVSLFGSVIVSKREGIIEIYSSKCTHLGCTINKVENGHMVCPCHGSQFSANGNVLQGPANKPLEKLPFNINAKTGEIMVHVEA